MAAPTGEWIWMDGACIPWEEARVHVLTHALHYGLGVFEGTRAYRQHDGSTAVFRLRDHLERLFRSARILQLELPYDLETLERATLEVIARNNLESCYIRHIAFVGAGEMGLHPKDNPIQVAIVAWAWGAYLGADGLANGIRCKVASFVRHFPNAMMNKAKATGGYLNSILAKREVVAQGYDEAILLDTQGFVSEGSGENIFVVQRGKLYTPQLTSALEGITRHTVMTLAERAGIEVIERPLTRDDLYVADEVFLTGTAAEITPVREIDDRVIGAGVPGPITVQLQEEFFRLVRGELPEFGAWLAQVPLNI